MDQFLLCLDFFLCGAFRKFPSPGMLSLSNELIYICDLYIYIQICSMYMYAFVLFVYSLFILYIYISYMYIYIIIIYIYVFCLELSQSEVLLSGISRF